MCIPLDQSGPNPPASQEEDSLTSHLLGKAGESPSDLPVCTWFFRVPNVTALSCPLPDTRVLKVKGVMGGGARSHCSPSGQKLKGEAREGGNRAREELIFDDQIGPRGQ